MHSTCAEDGVYIDRLTVYVYIYTVQRFVVVSSQVLSSE